MKNKEILGNLLGQLINEKLKVLEKKNDEESSCLSLLNNNMQSIESIKK